MTSELISGNNFPGYSWNDQLYVSTRTVVYRAVKASQAFEEKPRSVVIKLLKILVYISDRVFEWQNQHPR
jgi:hypothetical protein